MADFGKLIENVPDYKVFLTVDEMDAHTLALAEEYPDKVRFLRPVCLGAAILFIV